MIKALSKTIVAICLLFIVPASLSALSLGSAKAATKTDPGYQRIFDQEICPALKQQIPNTSLYVYCKDYPFQSDLDAAYHKICDVHGSSGDGVLASQCDDYKNYSKGSFTPASGTDAGVCSNGMCVDPAASQNADCSNNRCDFIGKYVNPFINLLTILFGIIAVISLILGGIQYSTSSGDPQQVGKAKKRIVNTLIALVAFFFLYGFLQFLIPGGLFNHRGGG